MELTNPDDVRLALQLAGLKPRKGLGQHFLIDRASLDTIVAAAKIGRDDTILEIGPGLGVMTAFLCAQAGRVVAVETDEAMANLLRHDSPGNLEVVSQSILDFDLRRLGERYKVVANLPYYLTSKILRFLLESPNPPCDMVVLVQREVAERITAVPGDMSLLALSVQYYAEPKLVGLVERHKFWPAPKVDSAILQITRRPQPAFAADPAKLFRLIKAGFGERRKMLKNSLAGGLNASVELITSLMDQAGIKATARAQELSLVEWHRLYENIIKEGLLS